MVPIQEMEETLTKPWFEAADNFCSEELKGMTSSATGQKCIAVTKSHFNF